ncbi:MAG: ATP12 family protein [Pseudomonadota bacterium]
MSFTPQRRFWSRVTTERYESGYVVALDGKPLRTPARADLVLPGAALARAVAAEWDAMEDRIDPDVLPLTKASNAAIDKVAGQRGAVVDMLAGFGGTDLLCYRADAPPALVSRQAEAWDPWLRWAEAELGATLITATGVMHVAQPAPAMTALHARADAFDAFGLAGLHDLVTLSGSLVLGLAVADGALAPAPAWDLSRIDETWQEAQWGVDAEAAAAADRRRGAFLDAARLLDLLKEG